MRVIGYPLAVYVVMLTALLSPPSVLAQSSAGLGGYQICTNVNFELNGRLSAQGVPPLADLYDTLAGNGTAYCTKDPSGAGGWVNVTLSFNGTDRRTLPCSIDYRGEYVLSGPFTTTRLTGRAA